MYAGRAIRTASPKALVYLDAGHSAWHSGADATARLAAADVAHVQGFSLNVSNYQWTPNLSEYGTWISDCLALHPDAATTTPTDCGDQYSSAGPANGNVGVALDPQKVWSATATDPTANTAGIDSRYAAELATAGAKPKAHVVVDTSRNGQVPGCRLPVRPTPTRRSGATRRSAGSARGRRGARRRPPQLDAYLWVKTPGQSDGQCNRGVTGSTTDPEWVGRTDPAAGDWFGRQALQLARLASPKLATSR